MPISQRLMSHYSKYLTGEAFLNSLCRQNKIVQSADYEIELFYDWPDDDDLKFIWNLLVVESTRPNVFMTWEWGSLWWRWYGSKESLRLLVVRDKSGILIIMPLHIQRTLIVAGVKMNVLRFVGDGGPVCPDFLGPIIKGQDTVELIKALSHAIVTHTGSWHAIQLADVLPESPGIQGLTSKLEHQLTRETIKSENCPFLTLPSNYESFLSDLSASQRESIRRRLRKAKKHYSVRFECVTTLEAVAPAFEDLLIIFKNSERGKLTEGGFNRADYSGFHKDVIYSFAEKGWLRLLLLYFDDVPVAFLYGYLYEGSFYFYQTGYDQNFRSDGAGSIILQSSIEQAISEGCTVFEFLRGMEEYKYHFASGERQPHTLTFWRRKGMHWAAVRTWKILSAFARKMKSITNNPGK